MSNAMKVWMIVAASLILVGCIIFVAVMTVLNWDFSKLSTQKCETNRYEITEAFQSLSINTNTADIVLISSENTSCTVVCYEKTNVKHTVTVKDGTLSIEAVDTRKWYNHIGINFDKPTITVCIPEGEYGALSIHTKTGDTKISKNFQFESMEITQTTGDITNYASSSGDINLTTTTGSIRVESISAESLNLSVTTGMITVSHVDCKGDVTVNVRTGDCELTDLACKKLLSNGSTGDMTLTGVTASERFSIERSTGDVTLDGSDAAELFITTDTGDVVGSLLSEKIFIINTDTGDKEVPHTTSGGRCEITTDTGDIRLTIKQ